MHLVGFVTRISHDARSSKCQKWPIMFYRLCQTYFMPIVHLQYSWAKRQLNFIFSVLTFLYSDRRRYTLDRNVVLTQILWSKCYDVLAIRPKHPHIAASDLACSESKYALIVKLLKWYNLVHAFLHRNRLCFLIRTIYFWQTNFLQPVRVSTV